MGGSVNCFLYYEQVCIAHNRGHMTHCSFWLSTVWQSRLKYLNNYFMPCHYSLYWHLWSSEDESSNGFRSPQAPHTGISSASKITQWTAMKFASDIYFPLRTIIVIAVHLVLSSHQNFILSSTLLRGASNYTFSCHRCLEGKLDTNWVSDRGRGNISADTVVGMLQVLRLSLLSRLWWTAFISEASRFTFCLALYYWLKCSERSEGDKFDSPRSKWRPHLVWCHQCWHSI